MLCNIYYKDLSKPPVHTVVLYPTKLELSPVNVIYKSKIIDKNKAIFCIEYNIKNNGKLK